MKVNYYLECLQCGFYCWVIHYPYHCPNCHSSDIFSEYDPQDDDAFSPGLIID